MIRALLLFILVSSPFAMGLLGNIPVKGVLADGYVDVSVLEARAMIEEKPLLVVLDVRNQSEYGAGHIRDAKLIPVWQLEFRLNELDRDDEILVYCGVGVRSANASQILVSNGFLHVYNMLGGLNAWIAAGYTVFVRYSSLQEAIDNATEGDTLNVSSGIYPEHLDINRSLTLNGENKYKTIVDGGGNGTVVNISADNITITGLTIQGSGCACADYAGVYVRTSHQNVNLWGNRIIQDGYGIKLVLAQGITIDQNEITDDTTAIEMFLSSNNTITENNITNNSNGIELIPSSNNTIKRNNIMNNTVHNIMFHSSSQNTVSENKLAYSDYGIRLYSSSTNNTLNQNTFVNNTIGIDVQNSTDNKIYQNNFLENAQQVEFFESGLANKWDEDNVTGGNYWSNYTGSDSNHDGIGDLPQILDSSNQDNYPLMGIFSSFRIMGDTELGVASNSTVEDLEYFSSNNTIVMHVTNTSENQNSGFCRLTIPHSVLSPPYTVMINNDRINHTTIFENATLSIVYFSYQHSTLEIVVVVPEFTSLAILALLGGMILLTAAAHRRRRTSSGSKSNHANHDDYAL